MDTSPIIRILMAMMVWLELTEAQAGLKVHRRRNLPPADPWQLFNISVKADGNRTEGLFPNVFNLATRADITSNATCGELNGSGGQTEQFCKLVEHVRRRPGDRIQCSTCSAGLPDAEDAHPISYAIDGSNRWWQSPTITNGWNYNWVTITLDLQQIYQVAYVIIKAANSPRPGNWILERSVDGETYNPWQYFAMTDSDCWNTYGVAPSVGVPRFKSDVDVICTSAFSQLDPLENGEIHISLVNGRPGVEGPSLALMDFTAARYIRLRLQRIRTLNADLMLPAAGNSVKYLDPTVTNRYYYSIKDISVGGQCICFGHARYCPIDPITRVLQCQCEGNTCGRSCEVCCPMFNQVAWRQGTYTESAFCEECSCFGHADECVFNETIARQGLSLNANGEYKGGGVCVNCQHNTMGINCEMCADGYFRPSNLPHDSPHACQPCDCTEVGATGICVKDDADDARGIAAGDCICREGYCGPRCDQCSPGYTGYPFCVKCPCNAAGSVNEDPCDTCVCKEHVCGDNCDDCLPGFYNLRADNPEGCDPCFCFGVSNQCSASTWPRLTIDTLDQGWYITDLSSTGRIEVGYDPKGALFFTTEQTKHLNRDIHWVAPQQFTRNKILAYGGSFEYSFHYAAECNETKGNVSPRPDQYLVDSDVILEGAGMRIGVGGKEMEEDTQHIVNIKMTEGGWRHLYGSTAAEGTPVRREDFMTVLADIDRFLVRAAYSLYQKEMTLLGINLEVASSSGTGSSMSGVEICVCPTGYSGTSCESCATGYRRVGNVRVGGVCEPCNCHGHSDTCDPVTGDCTDCKHNTHGASCEVCAYGHHGDARSGRADACQPCACPLLAHSYAESCTETWDELNLRKEYTCIKCREGHEGRNCERCIRGYYGNPLIPGSPCMKCNCSGNSVTGGMELCDGLSGRCRSCSGHTEGDHCEFCQSGYFGTAIRGDCALCQCDQHGSLDVTCDRRTGQCRCRERYAGRNCGQCQPGFGNVFAGCVPCNCRGIGVRTDICDPVSGLCICKPGVGGGECTECLAGFYQLSTFGCRSCDCRLEGSLSKSCDQATGQCQCKPGATGHYCDQCEMNYWGLASDAGCQPCNCDSTGSRSSQCDINTGSCQCKSGVAGKSCERCAVGHYGFSDGGCKRCRQCPHKGYVCHPDTGECLCPPLTEGRFCEQCVADAWSYHPDTGCKPCECDTIGSSGRECNVTTGQCSCFDDYTGRKCDKCPLGSYQFPDCIRCECDNKGTSTEQCDETTCGCQEDGQCVCKVNVEKPDCRSCKPETFSLSAENPLGCTACFCFGRTDHCRQAPYVWSEVTLPSQTAVFTSGEGTRLEPSSFGFLVIPEHATRILIDYQYSRLPLYWSLSKFVLGDQTLSYGGRLTFSLTVDGDTSSARTREYVQPDIFIVGNFRLKLHHSSNTTESSVSTKKDGSNRGRSAKITKHFDILLREDQWTTDAGSPVTREVMMTTLQNVQNWFVKIASQASGVREAQLEDIALEKAILAALGQRASALGIELCSCPPEYTGLSCQDPADGHYRHRPEDFILSEDVSDLIGRSESCKCNERSRTCDKETGHCQNCTYPFSGIHCESCAPGYYDTSDSMDPARLDCRQCACPEITNNRSPTCHPSTHQISYTCDACSEGYTGNICERCSAGYYGDPRSAAGCVPCQCSVHGARDQQCHPISGQCTCMGRGITGRACDQCQPRYAVIEGQCRSCDDGCTGELLSSTDELQASLDEFNATAAEYLPFLRLARIQATDEKYRKWMSIFNETAIQQVMNEMPSTNQFAEQLRQKTDELLKLSRTEAEVAADMKSEAEEVLQSVSDEYNRLKDVVDNVMKPAGSGAASNGNTLRQSEDLIRQMKALDTRRATARAEQELRLSTMILEKAQSSSAGQSARPGGGNENGENLQNGRNGNNGRRGGRGRGGEEGEEINRVPDVGDIRSRLEDLKKIIRETNQMTASTVILNKSNRVLLDALKNKKKPSGGSRPANGEVCKNASDLARQASEFLRNVTQKNHQSALALLDELKSMKNDLKESSEQLEEDLQDVMQKVSEAQEHAEELDQMSKNLEQSLAGSRQSAADPLRAVDAYESTYRAIVEAEAAVTNATIAVTNAYDKIVNSPEGALLDQARNSQLSSDELHIDATNFTDIIEKSLRPRIEAVNHVQESTAEKIEKIKDDLNDINEQISATSSSATSDAVDDIVRQTSSTLDIANRIDEDIDEKVRVINEDFVPKVDEMKELSTAQMDAVNATIIAARSQVDDLLNRTQALQSRKGKMQQLGSDIGQSILELKKLIEQARAQAASIKVSLYHKGGCVRKYAVPPKASLSNVITLHYKTNNSQKDQLLFLLRNPEKSDFLALELVDRKVRFVWNIGAGTAMVEHDQEIVSHGSRSDASENWYRIHAERRGNVGRLSVQLLSNGGSSSDAMVNATSPLSHTRLDLVPTMDLFIAGVTSSYNLPAELTARAFDGCIGEVKLDGRPIGLYNFRWLVSNVSCAGCFNAPVPDPVAHNVYQFNGEGYAAMPQVYYKAERFSVYLEFKVIWTESLLFFTSNDITGEFFAIELKDGRVVFRYGFGGGSGATLTTQRSYNTNEWVKLRASRTRLEGVLEVADEKITGSAADTESDEMNLAESTLYFAGIPDDVNAQKYSLTRLGLLGCMRDVQINSKGTYTQDFTEGLYFGMTPGCRSDVAHVIGLAGDGRIELSSPNLPREGSISFSFRSQQSDSLLLLAIGTNPDKFYSLSLVDGHIEVWLNAGSGIARLVTDDQYSDGLVHSVTVHKDNRALDLYIDNELVASERLPPGTIQVDSMRGPAGGLYVGGLPPEISGIGMAASLQPFKGCIMDLLINNQLLSFDTLLTFTNADVGRCQEKKMIGDVTENDSIHLRSPTPSVPSFTVTVTLPAVPLSKRPSTRSSPASFTSSTGRTTPAKTTLPPTDCAEDSFYNHVFNGVSFGDIKHSNAEVVVLKEHISENFNVSMQIRTYYDKGLLFYISNQQQSQYIALQLSQGYIGVIYKDGVGETAQRLISDITVGDGLWHNLLVSKSSTGISIQVDEEEPIENTIARNLDVNTPIYVGGLPKYFQAARNGVINESFKGCVRDFDLSGQSIDIANSRAITGVKQCFARAEWGVHFDGYGYSIYAESYKIHSDFSVDFDFRTNRETGVILTISSPIGTPALALEMFEGQLLFTASSAETMYSVKSDVCKFCLCDNQWHSVRASLTPDAVTLQVDSGRILTSVATAKEMILDTENELYIGGFPLLAVPQGATHTQEYYQGCLRNFKINGVIVDWHSTADLYDVHISGCPISDS